MFCRLLNQLHLPGMNLNWLLPDGSVNPQAISATAMQIQPLLI